MGKAARPTAARPQRRLPRLHPARAGRRAGRDRQGGGLSGLRREQLRHRRRAVRRRRVRPGLDATDHQERTEGADAPDHPRVGGAPGARARHHRRARGRRHGGRAAHRRRLLRALRLEGRAHRRGACARRGRELRARSSRGSRRSRRRIARSSILKRYLSPGAPRPARRKAARCRPSSARWATSAPEHRAVLAGEIETLAAAARRRTCRRPRRRCSRRQLALGLWRSCTAASAWRGRCAAPSCRTRFSRRAAPLGALALRGSNRGGDRERGTARTEDDPPPRARAAGWRRARRRRRRWPSSSGFAWSRPSSGDQ